MKVNLPERFPICSMDDLGQYLIVSQWLERQNVLINDRLDWVYDKLRDKLLATCPHTTDRWRYSYCRNFYFIDTAVVICVDLDEGEAEIGLPSAVLWDNDKVESEIDEYISKYHLPREEAFMARQVEQEREKKKVERELYLTLKEKYNAKQ